MTKMEHLQRSNSPTVACLASVNAHPKEYLAAITAGCTIEFCEADNVDTFSDRFANYKSTQKNNTSLTMEPHRKMSEKQGKKTNTNFAPDAFLLDS